MAINFDNINDTQKLEIADSISKIEALDALLADIQTERATAEVGWEAKKQEIEKERNSVREQMRVVRKATQHGIVA